ncbi:hypothetical protein Q7P37_011185 [Cladosporium fusiforme]
MGARFDKWLARPSTLRFLRQLVGPEHAAAPTKRFGSTNVSTRRHTTTCAPSIRSEDATTTRKNHDRQGVTDLETFQEQRRRVAKELRLHIPNHYHDPRTSSEIQATEVTGYSNLLYAETRVRDISSTRGLLIDHPENINNLEAWRQILQFRERTDGFNGVLDVWKGMRQRGIDLPVNGDHATTFWTIFLHAAIAPKPTKTHARLLDEVYTHAEQLKSMGRGHYRSFHKILLGRFLRLTPGRPRVVGQEYELHQRSRENGLCPQQSLAEVVVDVLKSTRPKLAFKKFKKIYVDDGDRDLYDLCMPLVLLHAGDVKTTLSWHNFFMSRNDKPGPELATNQTIQYLTGLDDASDGYGGIALPNRIEESELDRMLASDRATAARSLFPSLSRASMSSLVGDVYGIKPKAISDKFCARMFATQTFSLETIIRGIALLGTEAMGPVALRELAIRAGSTEEFKNRLADIKDTGMQLVPSIYTRLLERVTNNSQHDLFQALLDSDQHPESYDDQHVQESLLADFLRTENWSQAYLTLMGLSQADRPMASRAWNRLLQHHIKARDYHEVARIFEHIRAEQLVLSRRSLNFMRVYLLASRAPSKRPMVSDKTPTGNFKSLNFVVNAHMYAAERGSDVDHSRWIEFLKRYGMSLDMERVANLTAWLAVHCPPEDKKCYVREKGMVQLRRHKMPSWSVVFNPAMVRAIVIWGLHNAGARDALKSSHIQEKDARSEEYEMATLDATGKGELWTQGLSILLQLKRLGVPIGTDNVRRALEEVFWIWFGPGLSNRNDNLRYIERNELTLAHYVRHANHLWDEPLFNLAPELRSSIHTNEAQLLCAVFGHARRADQQSGTWVDVQAWATAKAEGKLPAPLPSRTTREEGFTNIPAQFTFVDSLPRRQRRVLRLNGRQLKRFVSRYTDQSITPQHPPPAAQTLSWRPQPNPPNIQEES